MAHRTKIGILALQGDFEAHRKAFVSVPNIEVTFVRTPEELKDLDGLALPGGESTTIGKLMVRHNLLDCIRERHVDGMAIYGTCAGLILLAKEIEESDQIRLGLMDIKVARNAFGRQLDSFEADIPISDIGLTPVRGVFIRAPYVVSVGPGVQTLAEYSGKIVAVRQGALLGTAFHPELTHDFRVHSYFVEMIRGQIDPSVLRESN